MAFNCSRNITSAQTRVIVNVGKSGMKMQEHVYKTVEIIGSSEKSVDDAIQKAIARASKTLNHLRWFEVIETRGHIEEGKIQHYQVTMKVGFTLEDET